jgi:molybdenum cofactor biosynthesis enzyme MoaA
MKNVELTSGWHDQDQMDGPVTFRWAERQATAVLLLDLPLPPGELAYLSVRAVDPGGELGGPTLTVSSGGSVLGQSMVGPEQWEEYAFPFPGPDSGTEARDRLEVELSVDRWVEPKPGTDPREYGLPVQSIHLLRSNAGRMPAVIELESTTACNIHPPCVMCYPKANSDYTPPPRPRDLDDQLLEAVAPAIREAFTLSLHGIGEPLVSGKTRALLESLRHRPLDTQFNSNGLLLSESWARLLVDCGLNRICFSIDAATPETYRHIRHADLQKVIDNIQRLQRIKEETGSGKPLVEMNMTLMRMNLGEAEAFIRLAADLGARYVVFGLLNKTADYSTCVDSFTFRYAEQMIDEEDSEFTETMAACRNLARELGVELTINTTEVPL